MLTVMKMYESLSACLRAFGRQAARQALRGFYPYDSLMTTIMKPNEVL